MFDLGFFELLVIGIVGLLVIGPERLPVVIGTTVLWVRKVKGRLSEIGRSLEQEIGLKDIQTQLREDSILEQAAEHKEQLAELEHSATQANIELLDSFSYDEKKAQ